MKRDDPKNGSLALAAGFSLVELIVVIVIVGIVAGAMGMFITRPIQGYVDLSRRATLVDAAESALRRMARDIRIALPNSVRKPLAGTGFVLELLPTLFGGQYSTSGGDPLDFASQDTSFDMVGCFSNFPGPFPISFTTHRLVINNLGTGGNDDAYTSSGQLSVITLPGTITYIGTLPPGVCGSSASNVTRIAFSGALSTGYQFKSPSPRKRLFVIQTPVTYLCDPSARTLTRYDGYPIQPGQPTTAAALTGLGAVGAVVADHVSACGVTTDATQVQQRGLVTLTLTLSDQGETIQLIHQVQLDNSR